MKGIQISRLEKVFINCLRDSLGNLMLEAFVTNTKLFMIKDTKGILMYLLIAKQ